MPFLVTCVISLTVMSSFIFHFVSEWRITCIRVDTTGCFTSALTDCGNDGLHACCLCSCFSLKSREMRAIWRVHRSDSWLTCHGNTVLPYWTNGPHLPKANIKHTERKHCVDSDRQCRVSSTNTVVTLTSTLVQLFAILMEVQSIWILLLRDSSKSKC